MPTSFLFEFNWSGDGTTWIDESANVFGAKIAAGMPPGFPESVAQIGTCILTLDNASQRYSPDYASGALFGSLLPRRQMRVRATDGVSTWPIFRGFIERIAPEAGAFSRRRVVIECVDGIALLAHQRVSLPLQTNQRADQIIAALVSATYTPPATNYHAGTDAFSIAADGWLADQTTALKAIRQCAESEFGRFFIQTDGTPTFFDRRYFFVPVSPPLTLNANPFALIVRRDAEQVYNVIKVIAHPRATVGTLSVLAQANGALHIPPVGPSGPGTRTVTLHFRDATGNIIGATGVITPLVPNTDYTINEKADGSLGDYTTSPYFAIATPDVRASEITLTLQNSALGPLFATKLQVRGQPVTTYDPVTQTREDAASQAAYQKRTLTHDLPLSADVVLAEALAAYLLDRYKAPFTRIESVTIRNEPVINGTNVFSLKLFDVISLSDAQTGISNLLCWISGLRLEITPEAFTLIWLTERADDRLYWNLGITGYSELGSTTRLAV